MIGYLTKCTKATSIGLAFGMLIVDGISPKP